MDSLTFLQAINTHNKSVIQEFLQDISKIKYNDIDNKNLCTDLKFFFFRDIIAIDSKIKKDFDIQLSSLSNNSNNTHVKQGLISPYALLNYLGETQLADQFLDCFINYTNQTKSIKIYPNIRQETYDSSIHKNKTINDNDLIFSLIFALKRDDMTIIKSLNKRQENFFYTDVKTIQDFNVFSVDKNSEHIENCLRTVLKDNKNIYPQSIINHKTEKEWINFNNFFEKNNENIDRNLIAQYLMTNKTKTPSSTFNNLMTLPEIKQAFINNIEHYDTFEVSRHPVNILLLSDNIDILPENALGKLKQGIVDTIKTTSLKNQQRLSQVNQTLDILKDKKPEFLIEIIKDPKYDLINIMQKKNKHFKQKAIDMEKLFLENQVNNNKKIIKPKSLL